MKVNWASILGSILDICAIRHRLLVKTSKKVSVEIDTTSPTEAIKRDWSKVADSWYGEF